MLVHRKNIGFAALLGIVLTACATAPLPGVKVRSVGTDLGLGVLQEAPEPRKPLTLGELPDFISGGIKIPPLPAPRPACPSKDPFDFPALAPASLLTDMEQGRYRWVHDMTILDAERARAILGVPEDEELEEGTSRFMGSRLYRGRTPDPGEQTGDQVVSDTNDRIPTRPIPEGQADRGTFHINVAIEPGLLPNPLALFREDRLRIQPSSYADNNEQEVDRDEGESIIGLFTSWLELDEEDPKGFNAWLLVYSPSPIFIQFPVASGQRVRWVTGGQPVNTFAAAAPGAATGGPQAMQEYLNNNPKMFGPRVRMVYDGSVVGRREYDACGTPVSAWLVEGILELDFEGRDPIKMNYDYAIATGHGGMIVYERFAVPATQREERLKTPSTPLPGSARIEPALVLEAFAGTLEPREE